MKKVLFVFGTRPEAIKMAPVVAAFRQEQRLKTEVCVTGQHRQMLKQMLERFHIKPDFDMGIMTHNQTLFDVTAKALRAARPILTRHEPHLVLVQGDTTTVMAVALGAFYLKIPVAHVEAGLRSFDFGHPFPEELNRIIADRIAALHFAATARAKRNLLAEGINAANIFVTGNTVVDALYGMLAREHSFKETRLKRFFNGTQTKNLSKLILVTAHRRENFGAPLEAICQALLDVVRRFPDVFVIYPVHLNPNVVKVAERYLSGHSRVLLTGPLDYLDLIELMRRCFFVMTDSGGIQEEAPSLGKPVLILRKTTERPEVLETGGAQLIGHLTRARIARAASRLLQDAGLYRRMALVRHPFGDGHASERILQAVKWYFGMTPSRPAEFRSS